MWTFQTKGEREQAVGFQVTLDGPVGEVDSEFPGIEQRAADLQPRPRALLEQALGMVKTLLEDTENARRRLSVNIDGGEGAQRAWSLSLRVDLAADPEA